VPEHRGNTGGLLLLKWVWRLREDARNTGRKVYSGCGSLRDVSVRNETVSLLDHLIRTRQHVGRNRQTDLVGVFQIDDELIIASR
jgi:hypothetical protein